MDPLLVIHVHFLVGHPRGVLDDHPAEQVYDDGDDGLAKDVIQRVEQDGLSICHRIVHVSEDIGSAGMQEEIPNIYFFSPEAQRLDGENHNRTKVEVRPCRGHARFLSTFVY